MKRLVSILFGLMFCFLAMAQVAITHTVKSGETVRGIAKQYDVPLEVLLQANPNMKEYFYVGMELNIPVKIEEDMRLPQTDKSSPSTFIDKPAEKVNENYLTDLTATDKKNVSKDIKTYGLMFWTFDDGNKGSENYGYFSESLTYNGLGTEFAIRTVFKKYSNYNTELGLNYTLGIYRDENIAMMLIGSFSPLSLRLQDTYDFDKGNYKTCLYWDSYFSVRSSFKFWKFGISLGYYYWMPKWCIDEGSKGLNGFSLGLHYVL